MMKNIVINEIANELVTRLKERDFIIQRYDAVSSDSVYLKLDYGMCHTIRISDHHGKRHLSYRYNLLTCVEEKGIRKGNGGHERRYYPVNMADDMIQDIVDEKEERYGALGSHLYRIFMEQNKEANKDAPGFWKKAKMV